MRAYTITTKSRSRAKAWHRVLALTLSACALAIPATASGNLSPVNAITGGSSDSSKPIDGWNYSILNSPASPQSGPGSSPQVDPGYSSPNATAGPLPDRFTVETPAVEPLSGPSDGFDWPSAAVGAGSAMALIAFGGAALLTVRRRTARLPSAPTS
jgi:hypothetical protein